MGQIYTVLALDIKFHLEYKLVLSNTQSYPIFLSPLVMESLMLHAIYLFALAALSNNMVWHSRFQRRSAAA